MKRILFALAAVGIFFVLLETIAGLINANVDIDHANVGLGIGGKDILEYRIDFVKDGELFWRLDRSDKDYNSAGFRDREIPPAKEGNTFRIICLGDSVTFGWPVEPENTYPGRLEKLLNSKFPGRNFEVFNAGIPGYTSYQGLIWVKKDILSYQPDLLIIYYGINDMSGSYLADSRQKTLPAWAVNAANYLRRFELVSLLNKIILHFKYPPSERTIYNSHRVSPGEYRDNLKAINKIAQGHGIQTLFMVRPALYSPEEKIVSTPADYLPAQEIAQLDIYNIFKKREKEAASLFLDDNRPFNFHLTAKGQAVLAEEVFGALVDKGMIAQPPRGKISN